MVTLETERPLSPRQAQIVNLAAAGHTDKEIAIIAGVSVGTLRTYWDRLRHRYDARSRSEVIAKALLKPPVSEMAAYMLLKLPLFVWTADPSGVTDYRNEWFQCHGGLPADAPPRIGVQWLMTDDERRRFDAHWQEARVRGELCEFLTELRCVPVGAEADAGRCAHKLRVIPIRNAEGLVVRWLGYAREIAEDADDRMVRFLLAILK